VAAWQYHLRTDKEEVSEMGRMVVKEILAVELAVKRVDILHEAVPAARRVAARLCQSLRSFCPPAPHPPKAERLI
jgi:hypothetical protein